MKKEEYDKREPLTEIKKPIVNKTKQDFIHHPQDFPTKKPVQNSKPKFANKPDQQALKEQKPCNCDKTQCLKLYCPCLKLGLYCLPNCQCTKCKNNLCNKEVRDWVVQDIISKNPSAFQERIAVTSNQSSTIKINKIGCNCRNSQCLKAYCECFANGIKCTKICNCHDCKNDDELCKDFEELLKIKSVCKRSKRPSRDLLEPLIKKHTIIQDLNKKFAIAQQQKIEIEKITRSIDVSGYSSVIYQNSTIEDDLMASEGSSHGTFVDVKQNFEKQQQTPGIKLTLNFN